MNINNIETSHISVVVQGAIDEINTPKCLNSIRRYLPGAEIILSTWNNCHVEGLNADCVIMNDDPGGYPDRYIKTFLNNTLRQLISTQEGIKKAHGEYILKLRSDLILTSNRFLKYFDYFPRRKQGFICFSHRIIVSSFFSKKFLTFQNTNQPVPFHISDWLAFGRAEDIKALYDIPRPIEPDFSWFLYDNPTTTIKPNLLGASHQYAPEQYITLMSFRKFLEINFSHYLDYTNENIILSEKLIANNYIILSPGQFSFYCGKKGNGKDRYKRWSRFPITMPSILWKGLYRPYIFEQDYQKYCDPLYKISLKTKAINYLEKMLHWSSL